MAVQNLMVSANWWGAGRFVFAQRVEGLRQALCSHPQSVTPPLRGVWDDTGARRYEPQIRAGGLDGVLKSG